MEKLLMLNKLSDPLDFATELAERERAFLVAEQLKKTENILAIKGYCYNCDEKLEAGLRFCDEDCRDDYDWMVKRGKANGSL